MGSLAELKAKVNARVAELIVPALFERAIRVHEKHAWKHCDCDWCQKKRVWHSYLQYVPHGQFGRVARENWRFFNVKRARVELAEKEKEILSLPTPARKGEAKWLLVNERDKVVVPS